MKARARSARLGIAALLSVATLVAPAIAADPPALRFENGVVVAAEPLAARAGLKMLEMGGNAIDAAVATGFVLAVTYPVAGNLGGGGFLVAAKSATDDEPALTIGLDFREVAPMGATRAMYLEAAAKGQTEPSTLGPLAAGVPGSVAGLLHAHEQWGKLDRKTVLQPALELALFGFRVPKRTADFLAADFVAGRMKKFSSTAATFYPDGKPLPEGTMLRQPELGRTLKQILDHGAAGFYEGVIADTIVNAMQKYGGIITHEDLKAYRPVRRDPVEFSFRGRRVVTMPLPSSGGVCVPQILGFVERAIRADSSFVDAGPRSSALYHVLAEGMRRSFIDRSRELGDPDNATIDTARLLESSRLDAFWDSFDPDLATPTASLMETPLFAAPESEETTHYSVFDGEIAVSVTTTLNGAFGSKFVVPGAGFFLNNEMDDFATRPGEPNQFGLLQSEANTVAPGRRPLSSMSPTVVLDAKGQVEIVAGSPGGPTIITNVCQVLVNLIVFGMEPQAAVNAPKIHHQAFPDRLTVERDVPKDVRDALRARGHELRERGGIGDFQLIVVDDGAILGASDPRGGGAAVGH